jgi:hypothetical protein
MSRKRGKPSHSIRIDDWDFDDANLEELAAHGLAPETVEQVATNEPRFRKNKKGRPATHQMIGPDDGGRTRVVCIVEIDSAVWRPITGWDAAEHEIEWWRKSR